MEGKGFCNVGEVVINISRLLCYQQQRNRIFRTYMALEGKASKYPLCSSSSLSPHELSSFGRQADAMLMTVTASATEL